MPGALHVARGAHRLRASAALLGIALATALRALSASSSARLCPYVVASQTIPIVALAPLIMFFVGHNVSSVVIIATYLSFFPVTIAMLRGLRSPDPRALELMRSYAASRRAMLWKVRFPASLPYLFTALKITATASIVGAIVGEGPGGIQAGLGRAILFFAQQYAIAPGEAVGVDPVHGRARHPLLPGGRARRRGVGPARPPGGGRRMSEQQPRRSSAWPASASRSARRGARRGAARHQPGDRARRVRLADRPFRLRQVDAAAADR